MPAGGQQVGVGALLGQVLDDDRGLGDALAVVELEQGHVAARVDRQVVAATLGEPVGGKVHLGQLDGYARLAGDDVRRERAGAGGVVELHRFHS